MGNVSLTVNGVLHELELEPRELLVYVLRERLGLMGTTVGCDTSSCGACTVLLARRSARRIPRWDTRSGEARSAQTLTEGVDGMRLRRLFGAVGAAGLVAAVAVSAASASISGPCAANIAGAGVAGRSGTDPAAAIHVQKGGLVNVAMSASSPISQLKVKLAFAGFGWTVKNGAASGNSWTRTLKVNDYATWGVGLYQVSGVSTGAALSCTGTALVRVEGNPLATVAGGTALGLSIVGVVGLLGGALRGRSRVGVVPLLGLVSGLFLGVGILTLLQEYGAVYPTRAIALAGILSGVLFGLLVPAVTHAFTTGHFGPWHFHHPAAGH